LVPKNITLTPTNGKASGERQNITLLPLDIGNGNRFKVNASPGVYNLTLTAAFGPKGTNAKNFATFIDKIQINGTANANVPKQ
jgi:hypothetical protein